MTFLSTENLFFAYQFVCCIPGLAIQGPSKYQQTSTAGHTHTTDRERLGYVSWDEMVQEERFIGLRYCAVPVYNRFLKTKNKN